MAAVRYGVSVFLLKWMVSMGVVRISALSKETVRWGVQADSEGAPVDPTGATAEAAFLPTDQSQPESGDWKAATWDRTLIGTYVAQVIVGPGAAFEPAAGEKYTCWLRITDAASGETVVRQAGQLLVA